MAETETLSDYLARNPAADGDVTLDVDLARGRVEVAASTRGNREMLFFLGFIAVLGIGIAISKIGTAVEGPELLAFGMIAVVFGALLGPKLWAMAKGRAGWRRSVRISGDAVTATDAMAGRTQEWRAPLSECRGIAHRLTGASGVAASGTGTKSVTYDVLEMVHPEAGKTVPLWKKPRTGTGGMSMGDMIRAGSEGRKDDVEAALNSRENPRLRAFAREAAETTGLRLLDDPDDFAGDDR